MRQGRRCFEGLTNRWAICGDNHWCLMAVFHCMPFCLGTKKPRFNCWVKVKVRYWYWSSKSFISQSIPLILSRSDKVLCSIRVFCYERLSFANCSAEITRDIWVSLERHTQKHESEHNICKSCGELVYLCSLWLVVVKTRPVRYPVRYYDLTYKNIVLLKKANQS